MRVMRPSWQTRCSANVWALDGRVCVSDCAVAIEAGCLSVSGGVSGATTPLRDMFPKFIKPASESSAGSFRIRNIRFITDPPR